MNKLIAAEQLAKDFRAALEAKDEESFWGKFDEACCALTTYDAIKQNEPRIDHTDAGLYIRLKDTGVNRTTIVNQWPHVAVDFDILNEAVGIEVVYSSEVTETPESIKLEAIDALRQIFKWWDLKDGHLVTHFHIPVNVKMESFRSLLNDKDGRQEEVTANDVRKWLIDNVERMKEQYGGQYHYSVLDVEEAIAAIKQARAKSHS